jgi:hypothetical protein
MADPEKVRKQDGKVFDIGDVQLTAEYIDPVYMVIAPTTATDET